MAQTIHLNDFEMNYKSYKQKSGCTSMNEELFYKGFITTF